MIDNGTENEPCAISTSAGKVLTVLSPALLYQEEGCVKIGVKEKYACLIMWP